MDSRALEKHFEAIIAEQQKLATIEFDEGVDSRMDSYFVQVHECHFAIRVLIRDAGARGGCKKACR